MVCGFKKTVPFRERPEFDSYMSVGGVLFMCPGMPKLGYQHGRPEARYNFFPVHHGHSVMAKTASGYRYPVWPLLPEDQPKVSAIRDRLVNDMGYEMIIKDLEGTRLQ